MDYGTLLTDSKWNIIQELAKHNQTPTDLANKTKTSLANISQQLRLLEAYGLVKKERRISTNEPGKPKTLFSLGKEVNHLTFITKQLAVKKELELDYLQKAILKLWLTQKKEDIYFLEKFLITNEEIPKKCDAIGIVKTTSDKIELLLITKHTGDIREKYSNQTITNIEDQKKEIICWTHTIEEMEEGLANNNEYFKGLVTNLQPFLEKDGLINRIIKSKNGKNQ